MSLSSRQVVVLFLIAFTLVATLWLIESSTFYEWRQRRMVQRILAADPVDLLKAARALLANRPGFAGSISPRAPEVPSAIRRLNPTHISISTNSLNVGFGDAFNPFGIIAIAAEAPPRSEPKFGRGPRQWIEGLWLYDDGQLEKFGHRVGLTEENWKSGSMTSRTSSVAGSPR